MEPVDERAPREGDEDPSGSTDEAIAAWMRDAENEDSTQTSSRRARPASVTGASASERPAAAPHATLPGMAWTRFAAGGTVSHYEIIRALGRGGMGEVYLARDTRLGRRVALKTLRFVDAQRSARFMAEARAIAQFTHENIVALYARVGTLAYMAPEQWDGEAVDGRTDLWAAAWASPK